MNFVEFKVLKEMFPLFPSDPHSSSDQNPDEHRPTIFHMLEKNSIYVCTGAISFSHGVMRMIAREVKGDATTHCRKNPCVCDPITSTSIHYPPPTLRTLFFLNFSIHVLLTLQGSMTLQRCMYKINTTPH